MHNFSYRDWDRVYREYPLETLPWELGKPRETLVALVKKGQIKPGKALDICCGAGTNTVYLAQQGFEVAAVEISKRALEYAKKKMNEAKIDIRFVLGSFVTLPFKDEEFDFVLDMGCFHHVEIKDRDKFIEGICRVLRRNKGQYLLICFSDKNGPAWNHFAREQIIGYFSPHFKVLSLEHFGSIEADGDIRFFYSALMRKLPKSLSSD